MTGKNEGSLRCGLLGGRLGHSFSPQIHKELAAYSYQLFAMPEENVPDFLRTGPFDAINVTIPYKQLVMPYCRSISDEARKIGSVNTLLRDEQGELHGYNTDYFGFSYMAAAAGISFQGQKVLILGSGGTSHTARAVTRDEGAAQIVVVSRRGENNYDNLKLHRDAEIIVNTTPVGMFPETEKVLIQLSDFPDCKGVLEVIYNPLRTRLLQQALQRGIPCSNGLRMLVAQAMKASELFLGRRLPEDCVEKILSGMNEKTRNIILIGMPGCGKSTLGKKIAAALQRPFVDIDREIEKEQARSIADIFAGDGEEEFRRIEAETVRKFSLGCGQVIATGGGAVLAEKNRLNLRQNGLVFYIHRNTELLELGNGRPLSVDAGAVRKMAAERENFYLAAADCIVENNDRMADCQEKILRFAARADLPGFQTA